MPDALQSLSLQTPRLGSAAPLSLSGSRGKAVPTSTAHVAASCPWLISRLLAK